MSDIKYRIELGNCETDINSDIAPVNPVIDPRWDSTEVFFDSTIITFDNA